MTNLCRLRKSGGTGSEDEESAIANRNIATFNPRKRTTAVLGKRIINAKAICAAGTPYLRGACQVRSRRFQMLLKFMVNDDVTGTDDINTIDRKSVV